MEKCIVLNGREIAYFFTVKKVKNINLRIKRDGTIHVSAPKGVSERVIDGFLVSKADFILNAVDKYINMDEKALKEYFSEEELRAFVLHLCERYYPYFRNYCAVYPKIRFRRMISRWGSCHPVKGILTFNLNLTYAPERCVEYVVLHEFTHFLQANHSREFYKELAKVCPDWKVQRKTLKEIKLR